VCFHLPVCFPHDPNIVPSLPGMAVNMRRSPICRVIGTTKADSFGMLDLPRFAVCDLPVAQVANAACVSEYLRPALWGYGGAFSHSIL
jgi:hypothetical protein